MAQYKLYYFEFKARAEVVRLVFAAAGQKWEDIRFPRDKWPEFKPKAPFGQAPFLEITEGSNTIVLAQSVAIARYLSKKFGLAGKDELEQVHVDMYADLITDTILGFIDVLHETDEARKKEKEQKFKKETLPNQLKFIDDRLAKSSSGFIADSGLTFADLHLHVLVDWFKNEPGLLDSLKHIKANHEKVSSIPKIANWLKTRPESEF